METNDQSITIEQAAEILGISRDLCEKLTDDGVIPQHKIGDTRCVYLRDVLTYRDKRNKERAAALIRISRAAADAGLYDSNTFPDGGQDE